MAESNDGALQEDEALQTAEELLAKERAATSLLKKISSKPEFVEGFRGKRVEVFHEVFVVGKVEPWRPKDRGGRHMGWGVYPVNPTVFQDGDVKLKTVEIVSFDDINNEIPEIGDLIHIRRQSDRFGRRLSAEIIKESPKIDKK